MSTLELRPSRSVATDVGKTQHQKGNNKFHLGSNERRLPRPIVFWSDSERDAFRRNKIVQTRYVMLIDEIENQRKASNRAIRYEAHKFRQRTLNFSQCGVSDMNSVTGSDFTHSSKVQNLTPQDGNDGSISSSGHSEKEDDFWKEHPQKGVLTKTRKSTVKFSVYKEYIPSGDKDVGDIKESRIPPTTWINNKVRSVSAAPGTRTLPAIQMNVPRSKSVVPSLLPYRKLSLNSASTVHNVNSIENTSSKDTKRSLTPNKMFFDRSQAAYQLRKELQRLAKIRKQGIVSSTFSMESALQEQKLKYLESRDKVTEYLEKLDTQKANGTWYGCKMSLQDVDH